MLSSEITVHVICFHAVLQVKHFELVKCFALVDVELFLLVLFFAVRICINTVAVLFFVLWSYMYRACCISFILVILKIFYDLGKFIKFMWLCTRTLLIKCFNVLQVPAVQWCGF